MTPVTVSRSSFQLPSCSRFIWFFFLSRIVCNTIQHILCQYSDIAYDVNFTKTIIFFGPYFYFHKVYLTSLISPK